jgi:hypothetical protein
LGLFNPFGLALILIGTRLTGGFIEKFCKLGKEHTYLMIVGQHNSYTQTNAISIAKRGDFFDDEYYGERIELYHKVTS